MVSRRKYIRVQIDSIKWAAVHKLVLYGDDLGARALHEFIEQWVTWQEIEKLATQVEALVAELDRQG